VYKLIVVGTDGSGSATTAVRHAIALAKAVDAELVVVSAYPEAPALSAESPPPRDIPTGPGVDADAIASRAADEARAAGVGVERCAQQGDPSEVILSVAEDRDADLVVVGNKGMAGVRRFLLGSVPNKISHHAPCSVLIVHTS
jgi:nucleotide-binding universal stress UspA family protein